MSYNWIGVDLDATLAHYEHWTDLFDIGEPIWPMVERVKQWLREGKKVKIFTARACPPFISKYRPDATEDEVVTAIQEWSELYIGERLPVTYIKDRWMIELWDDRCVQVEPNTGEPTTYWVSKVQ